MDATGASGCAKSGTGGDSRPHAANGSGRKTPADDSLRPLASAVNPLIQNDKTAADAADAGLHRDSQPYASRQDATGAGFRAGSPRRPERKREKEREKEREREREKRHR